MLINVCAGGETKKDKIISDSVAAITVIVTIGAMYYIRRKTFEALPKVIYDRRKARYAHLLFLYIMYAYVRN